MAPVKYFFVSAGLLMSVMADYVSFAEWPASLTAGQPVTLKWVGGSDAPVTITLRKGASTDLHDIQVLTNDATNGVFTWTPPANLQNSNDYAFQITQGDQINYTGLLPLSGGSDAPNVNALDRTQTDAANLSSSASATETAATAALTDSVATAASVTGTTTAALGTTTEPPATTDTAAGTTSSGASNIASEEQSSATTTPVSTETVSASKMNTPFVGSHMATPTATSSSSSSSSRVQADSAGRVAVPLALLAGSAAFLLLLVQ